MLYGIIRRFTFKKPLYSRVALTFISWNCWRSCKSPICPVCETANTGCWTKNEKYAEKQETTAGKAEPLIDTSPSLQHDHPFRSLCCIVAQTGAYGYRIEVSTGMGPSGGHRYARGAGMSAFLCRHTSFLGRIGRFPGWGPDCHTGSGADHAPARCVHPRISDRGSPGLAYRGPFCCFCRGILGSKKPG